MLGDTVGNQSQLRLTFEAGRQVYQVGELTAALQNVLDRQFRGIWVAGEISGCRTAASGHYYFVLKDAQSQLKCALFKGSARYVRYKPRDGLQVLVRGSLEIYEARGEYQLIVEAIEPQGAGALQLAFEKLKTKLAAEGLFDPSRKKPLPKYPRRIGIVTSPDGAVIRDMLHVFERRFRGLHLRLYPAQVQGEGSAEQICRGVVWFNRHPWADLLIVARGGGSLEDLWSFNEESVARAIAASTIPIISAVGHETDFTIADFVADHRAPTPSAAAEVAICTRDSLVEQIGAFGGRALQAIRYKLLRSGRDLNQRGTERAAVIMHRMVARHAQRVDELDFRMRSLKQKTIERRTRRLAELIRRLEATDLRLRFLRDRRRQETLRERLIAALQTRLREGGRRLNTSQAHLKQLSPYGVLLRGYAIVETQFKQVIRSASETRSGEALRVRLSKGELDVTVENTRDGE